jgi:hypothetical protein
VNVDGDTACFAGTTYDATGNFANQNGKTRVTQVIDGGEPGIGVDLIRGNWTNVDPQTVCDGFTPAGFEATFGNIQVHSN